MYCVHQHHARDDCDCGRCKQLPGRRPVVVSFLVVWRCKGIYIYWLNQIKRRKKLLKHLLLISICEYGYILPCIDVNIYISIRCYYIYIYHTPAAHTPARTSTRTTTPARTTAHTRHPRQHIPPHAPQAGRGCATQRGGQSRVKEDFLGLKVGTQTLWLSNVIHTIEGQGNTKGMWAKRLIINEL